MSLSEKFHPRNRHWPSGMPDSIARTEKRDKPAVLNLVDVYCPNTGCKWHVRVDEKVKEYNLNGHLLTCNASQKPQEASERPARLHTPYSPDQESEELRTAPVIRDLEPGESLLGPPEPLLPDPETILEEASRLVDGPREAHYGHPADDFSRVIGAFNALFAEYLEKPLETRHWPLIMQLCKLSREIHEPKRDNWVDGAGYWRTLEKIFEREPLD